MNVFWERQLSEIREQLLLMSGLTERSLVTALRGLVERDESLCDAVEEEDSQIDLLEVQIDEKKAVEQLQNLAPSLDSAPPALDFGQPPKIQ